MAKWKVEGEDGEERESVVAQLPQCTGVRERSSVIIHMHTIVRTCIRMNRFQVTALILPRPACCCSSVGEPARSCLCASSSLVLRFAGCACQLFDFSMSRHYLDSSSNVCVDCPAEVNNENVELIHRRFIH